MKKIKIKEDKKNFNKHSEKGMELLEESIRKVGIIESITMSSDNNIISGNARHEKIKKVLGCEEPIIIETDGKKPIILKRTDIKSGTKEFHEAALLANTVSKHNINLDEDFAGDGVIWHEVKKRTSKKINILRIDLKSDKNGVYLHGDNLKFMGSMDLSKFDIIDLDAYGSPFKQLQHVFRSNFSGIVHCTYIQSGMGRIDNGLLKDLGYSDGMIKKCPTLFCKNGLNKMIYYLANKNVEKITGYFIDRKNYFYFKITT